MFCSRAFNFLFFLSLFFFVAACSNEKNRVSCVTSFDCANTWTCEDGWCVEFPDEIPADKDITDTDNRTDIDSDNDNDVDGHTDSDGDGDTLPDGDVDTDGDVDRDNDGLVDGRTDDDALLGDGDDILSDNDDLASDDDSLLVEGDQPIADEDTIVTDDAPISDDDTAVADDATIPDDDTALPYCGNGNIDGGETCDAGAGNGTYGGTCNSTCSGPAPRCGDGGDSVSTSGLVLRYRLDETAGTSVTDISGNGNHGNISGASWVGGKQGNGLLFNGGANTLTTPNSGSLQLNNMTVAAWIYIPSSVVVRHLILGKGGWMNQNYGIWVETDDMGAGPVGHLMFHFDYDDLNVGAGVHTPLAYNDNTWHHVAGTYDGIDLKIYVDGALVATKNYPGLTPDVTGDALVFGNMLPTSLGYTYFNGYIDEVHIYNRALGAAEIVASFNNVFEACDDGGNGDGDGCSGACAIEGSYICNGFPTTCIKYCTHSIKLRDSGYNGWYYMDSSYGYEYINTVDISVNGALVYDELYLPSGYESGWYNYTVYQGRSESVIYTRAEISPAECSFEIRDQANGGGNQLFNATYPTTHSVSSASCP